MPLLRLSARELLALRYQDRIGERLAEQMRFRLHQTPSPAEVRSWDRSLGVLADDLIQAGLDDVAVLLEYQLPLSSKRTDAILAGVHPVNGHASYVVVELKQWSAARRYQDDASLVVVDGQPGAPRLHPIEQVRGYCTYMLDFVRSLQGHEDAVAGVAYLHNATTPEDVTELFDHPADAYGRLFAGYQRSAFIEFLKSRLRSEQPGSLAADWLLDSAVAPSRQLLTVAAAEVQAREQFTLLDEQRLAYELVLHEVDRARRADRKSVVLVTGGPGSGKSVIALSLLGELARRGRSVLHATGSRSFTQTLRRVAGHRNKRVQTMFKYFNSFMAADRNGFDVLICDEAHRIRETSQNRYTRAEYRTDRPQIDELLAAARVPVFLLDEHQVVKPGELGSVGEIRAYAASVGLRVHQIDLAGQFRCGGSSTYERWVARLLGLQPGGPVSWDGDDAFAVEIVDTPFELEARLRAKLADGYGARMAAGYCWPWSSELIDGQLVADVRIDDWAKPWNVRGDRRVGSAPPSALWASDPGGFEQVGCIYTAQGFEYDWSGVIIGPDLLWRDGRLVTDRSGNRDPDLRNPTRVPDEDFDRLVRNVYKVLLTRGMLGTVIYATDAHTRARLRALVGAVQPATLS